MIGHLLCWERHERDGTWYAWVSWVQSTGDPVRHRHQVVSVRAAGVRRLENPEAYKNVPRRASAATAISGRGPQPHKHASRPNFALHSPFLSMPGQVAGVVLELTAEGAELVNRGSRMAGVRGRRSIKGQPGNAADRRLNQRVMQPRRKRRVYQVITGSTGWLRGEVIIIPAQLSVS